MECPKSFKYFKGASIKLLEVCAIFKTYFLHPISSVDKKVKPYFSDFSDFLF